MTKEEQEVTISFCEGDPVARVYCASPVWIRKFDRLVRENPESFRATEDSMERGEVVGRFYEFPKSLITIRAKKRTANLTEEQREALRERARRGFGRGGSVEEGN